MHGARQEGLGLLPLQAMACGCFVVTTEPFVLGEYEKNVLVSPNEDWQDLAKNLDRVMNDDDLRERLAEKPRKLAQQYDIKKSCAGLEKLLLSFIAEKKGLSITAE